MFTHSVKKISNHVTFSFENIFCRLFLQELKTFDFFGQGFQKSQSFCPKILTCTTGCGSFRSHPKLTSWTESLSVTEQCGCGQMLSSELHSIFLIISTRFADAKPIPMAKSQIVMTLNHFIAVLCLKDDENREIMVFKFVQLWLPNYRNLLEIKS